MKYLCCQSVMLLTTSKLRRCHSLERLSTLCGVSTGYLWMPLTNLDNVSMTCCLHPKSIFCLPSHFAWAKYIIYIATCSLAGLSVPMAWEIDKNMPYCANIFYIHSPTFWMNYSWNSFNETFYQKCTVWIIWFSVITALWWMHIHVHN